MKGLFGCIRAEFVKMRHTFLYPLHVAVPLIGSVIFLLYYRAAGWSEMGEIGGYIEIIGIALPFMVSVVCAGNVGLEEQNHFQAFLGGTVYKRNSFLAKFLTLLGLGTAAVAAAVFLFAAGYGCLPGKESIPYESFGLLAVILCLGSIPLYLEHLFLNLMFARQVSLCVGAAQFLLSALFLTGLGEGRWPFFPCTWSARGVSIFLTFIFKMDMRDILIAEMKKPFLICLLIMLVICVIIGVWVRFYEGRQCND